MLWSILLVASLLKCSLATTDTLSPDSSHSNQIISADGKWFFRVLTTNDQQQTMEFTEDFTLPAWLRLNDSVSITAIAIDPKSRGKATLSILNQQSKRIMLLEQDQVFPSLRPELYQGHLDGAHLLPMNTAVQYHLSVPKNSARERVQLFLKSQLDESLLDKRRNIIVHQFNFIVPALGSQPNGLVQMVLKIGSKSWPFITTVLTGKKKTVNKRLLVDNDLPVKSFDVKRRDGLVKFIPRLPPVYERLLPVKYDPVFGTVQQNTHLTGSWNPDRELYIRLGFSQLRRWACHTITVKIWLHRLDVKSFKPLLVADIYDSDVTRIDMDQSRYHNSPPVVRSLIENAYATPPHGRQSKNYRRFHQTEMFNVTVASFKYKTRNGLFKWANMPQMAAVNLPLFQYSVWAKFQSESRRLDEGLYYWQIELFPYARNSYSNPFRVSYNN